MPQVTLSVPHEKLPILNDFLVAMGIERKNVQNILPKNSFRTNITRSVKNTANSLYKSVSSWEYFSNELEFE